ncbi:Protein kinase domain containing protein [Neofusicoccum parvum]|nr:Protein kinase domain containing protein [Neofusicoccum parvum]
MREPSHTPDTPEISMGSAADPLPASLTPTEVDESSASLHTSSTRDTEPAATQPTASCDCFAHLRPANLEACLAFDEVASEIKNSPEAFPYHRNFISIETIVPLSSLRRGPPTDADGGTSDSERASQTGALSQPYSFNASATEPDTDDDGAGAPDLDPRLVWTGHYRFSLAAPLELPPLGWRVGGGRWRKSKQADGGEGADANAPPARANGGVDLLLAKTRLPAANLAGLHARFAFERNGAFMLAVENPRRPSVVLGDEAFDAGSRVLAKPRCRIGLGNLAYVFEFVVRAGGAEKERAFEERLAAFLRETFRGATPPRELLASPAEADHPLCDWLIRGTVGRGAFGTVTAARHRVSGRVAAAKMVVRTQRSLASVMKEIDVSAKVPEHPNVSTLIDTIYERGDRFYTGPRPERIWLISTPFVRDTLHSLIQSSPSSAPLPPPLLSLRLALFRQLLAGLAHLHAHGFIHRDIKPANLGLVSPPTAANPPRVVILDFGHAVRAPRALPLPGCVGTIPYLAPEMEHAEYGPGVDVWALGVVGWQLFVQKGLPWRRVPEEEAVWRGRVGALREKAEGEESVYGLLVRMLEWDEEDRIGVDEALAWKCFEGVTTEAGREDDVEPFYESTSRA